MSRSIGWGIIGCGDVVERKAGPSLQEIPGSRIAAVMRRSAAKAEDFARRHRVPCWTTHAKEVFQHPEVDAVYVATPPVPVPALGSFAPLLLVACAVALLLAARLSRSPAAR